MELVKVKELLIEGAQKIYVLKTHNPQDLKDEELINIFAFEYRPNLRPFRNVYGIITEYDDIIAFNISLKPVSLLNIIGEYSDYMDRCWEGYKLKIVPQQLIKYVPTLKDFVKKKFNAPI